MQALLRSVALALVALGLAGAARADERNDKAPCSAAEHHQFDFWIGHWDVFLPNGNKAGENRIEAIEGGCALLEQWSGRRQRASALGKLQGRRQDLEHRVRRQVRQEEAAVVVRPRPAARRGLIPLGGREQSEQGGRFMRRART
jgi:hypothetical protein